MFEMNQETFNKILLVEDNPGDARLVELYLEESDLFQFNIVHCLTLKDAIDTLAEGGFAAVLLDISLPDSTGFPTLEKLLTSYPEENVIVLTGFSDKTYGLKAIKTGAQDYLVKGDFDSEMLSKTLKYSFERNRIIKRLEEVQRITHIGHWELDLRTVKLEASDEAYRIFGAPADVAFNYELILSYLHPDDVKVPQELFKILHEKKEVSKDLRIIRRDDSQRYINVLARRVMQDGKIVSVSGVVQDITERKQAEEEIVKGKERYENIFNRSKDAIFITKVTGEFLDFNPATGVLFGYTDDELKSINPDKLYKDITQRRAFEKEMLEKNSVRDFNVDFIQKNGAIRNCLVTSNVVVTAESTEYHGIIRDITDRMQAEQLRKDKEIAERSAKLKEQFLANVSHEMRTPMNAIIGMSHLLQKEDLSEDHRNYVNLIKQSSEHLLGIINDILDIAKSQFDEIEFEEVEFNLMDIIKKLDNMWKVQANQKQLGFEVKVGQNIPKIIVGDHLRLNQILINLTSNAVKFTEKGNISLTLYKTNETDEDVTLRFEVSDTGIGMTEDQLEIIFEPFTRVAKSKDKLYEGTGLGLSIIKRFVELQGGKIDVKSVVGKGSVFGFELTFKKSATVPVVAATKVLEDMVIPEGQHVKILIVEDNTINQIVARKTITKQWPSVHVEVAGDGKIAITKFNENDYDIILMDIQMPVMNGEEATKYIRTQFDEPKRSTPIIAMTAHVHVKEDQKFMEYGMDDCVLKPFKPEELFEIVLKHLPKKNQPSNTSNNIMSNEFKNKSYQFIDLEYLETMSDHDDHMKSVLLEMLLKDPIKDIKRMKEDVAKKDWDAVSDLSHKLKTTFPYVGYTALIDTNKAINDNLKKWKDGNITTNEIETLLPDMADRVEMFFRQALVELQAEFKDMTQGAA